MARLNFLLQFKYLGHFSSVGRVTDAEIGVQRLIPASPKYFTFLMIFSLCEEMNQKVKNNSKNNERNQVIPWSLVDGRRQNLELFLSAVNFSNLTFDFFSFSPIDSVDLE